MSVQAISWVLDKSRSEKGARLVLISIANHAKADGTGAWPSVATIAAESRLSEREVRYSIRKLEDLGELTKELCAGPHRSNMYSLPGMAYAAKVSGAEFAVTSQLEPCKIPHARVQNLHPKGANSAPKPSLTVLEPSKEKDSSPKPAALPKQKDYSDAAISIFRDTFATEPTWNEKHYVQLAALLKRAKWITVEEFRRRYINFVKSPDVFHQRKAGNLGYFCANFDEFKELPKLLGRQTETIDDIPLLIPDWERKHEKPSPQ